MEKNEKKSGGYRIGSGRKKAKQLFIRIKIDVDLIKKYKLYPGMDAELNRRINELIREG